MRRSGTARSRNKASAPRFRLSTSHGPIPARASMTGLVQTRRVDGVRENPYQNVRYQMTAAEPSRARRKDPSGEPRPRESRAAIAAEARALARAAAVAGWALRRLHSTFSTTTTCVSRLLGSRRRWSAAGYRSGPREGLLAHGLIARKEMRHMEGTMSTRTETRVVSSTGRHLLRALARLALMAAALLGQISPACRSSRCSVRGSRSLVSEPLRRLQHDELRFARSADNSRQPDVHRTELRSIVDGFGNVRQFYVHIPVTYDTVDDVTQRCPYLRLPRRREPTPEAMIVGKWEEYLTRTTRSCFRSPVPTPVRIREGTASRTGCRSAWRNAPAQPIPIATRPRRWSTGGAKP